MQTKKYIRKSKLLAIKDSDILVLEKNKNSKRYVLAGGFLKKGESPEQGLVREVQEETGVDLITGDMRYYSSSMIIGKKKEEIRYYYLLLNNNLEFINMEPQNFKSIKWVKWTKAMKYLNKHDKNTVERFYNHKI